MKPRIPDVFFFLDQLIFYACSEFSIPSRCVTCIPSKVSCMHGLQDLRYQHLFNFFFFESYRWMPRLPVSLIRSSTQGIESQPCVQPPSIFFFFFGLIPTPYHFFFNWKDKGKSSYSNTNNSVIIVTGIGNAFTWKG